MNTTTSLNGLERFYRAHERDYATALLEIRRGYKQTHWMWYIFPQIRGLGRSATAQYYAIADLGEAFHFLTDPYLGGHLTEISEVLLKCQSNDAVRIFGSIDAMKLRSSMTLFHYASGLSDECSVFYAVLRKFFGGEPDPATIRIIEGGKTT